MPRRFEESVSKRQDLDHAQKVALQNRMQVWRLNARRMLANRPNLTLDEKVEILIDYVVGGE